MQSAFLTGLLFSQGGPPSTTGGYWFLKASKRERQKTSLSPDRRHGPLETSQTERQPCFCSSRHLLSESEQQRQHLAEPRSAEALQPLKASMQSSSSANIANCFQ